jgi:hypothetical protein
LKGEEIGYWAGSSDAEVLINDRYEKLMEAFLAAW